MEWSFISYIYVLYNYHWQTNKSDFEFKSNSLNVLCFRACSLTIDNVLDRSLLCIKIGLIIKIIVFPVNICWEKINNKLILEMTKIENT